MQDQRATAKPSESTETCALDILCGGIDQVIFQRSTATPPQDQRAVFITENDGAVDIRGGRKQQTFGTGKVLAVYPTLFRRVGECEAGVFLEILSRTFAENVERHGSAEQRPETHAVEHAGFGLQIRCFPQHQTGAQGNEEVVQDLDPVKRRDIDGLAGQGEELHAHLCCQQIGRDRGRHGGAGVPCLNDLDGLPLGPQYLAPRRPVRDTDHGIYMTGCDPAMPIR